MVEDLRGPRVAVTGAAGFIGRAVVDRIARGALGELGALRLNDVRPIGRVDAIAIHGSYADPDVLTRFVDGGLDILIHLASLPGAGSERDPVLGRRVNLDGSLALLDAAGGAPAPVVVYASSIAALGRPTEPVTDATALRPTGSYGTHKAMVELHLAELTRRGLIDGRAVRPAGIVARPAGAYAGFATAWLSDLFHAAREGRGTAIPVAADALVWLQSVDAVADNIIHAALLPPAGLPAHRAWTLPATIVRVDVLVDALGRRTGQAPRVDYGDAAGQPELDAAAALELGFVSDGDADALVDAVLSRLARDAAAACRPGNNSLPAE